MCVREKKQQTNIFTLHTWLRSHVFTQGNTVYENKNYMEKQLQLQLTLVTVYFFRYSLRLLCKAIK